MSLDEDVRISSAVAVPIRLVTRQYCPQGRLISIARPAEASACSFGPMLLADLPAGARRRCEGSGFARTFVCPRPPRRFLAAATAASSYFSLPWFAGGRV
jgi:hypothetical protein